MKLVKNKKILIIVGAVVIVAIGFYNAVGTEISWQDFLSESNLLNEETAIDQPIENEVEVDENLSAGGDEPEVPLYKPVVDYETAVTEAVEKSSPAVVSIIVTKDLPVFESCQQGVFVFPCQTGTASQEVGGGTGFIVTSDGLIITNKHVVNEEGASYTVLTNNGKKYEATVLARDPVIDLAVIKIETSGLATVKLGDSEAVKLGQTAIAIGNALGEFKNTVSVGVISGEARNVTAEDRGVLEKIEGLFQTDAAINPGNSGGPLLNLKGEVIGINTAVATGAQNIGFAIPINMAKRSISSVKESGKIVTPFLGVRYVLIDNEFAERNSLSVTEGAYIAGGRGMIAVTPDSPAEKAGLVEGDIIISIGGENISETKSLAFLIRQYKVDEWVEVKILRGTSEFVIRVQLAGRES